MTGPVEWSKLRERLKDLGLDVAEFDDLQVELSSLPLPTLKYGYTDAPWTWEQLQELILVEQDLAKLSRSAEQQREYEIFRYCLKRQYESVLDHILISKFDFERRKTKEGRWQAYPSLKDSTTVQTRLVLNDFPYCMPDGIVHYIFWKTKESVTPKDIENAKLELRRQRKVADTLHWINPPHLQSLPDIDHVHILCKLEDGTTPLVNNLKNTA